MILAHAQSKTGHPNCRRPDKVIDGGQIAGHARSMGLILVTNNMKEFEHVPGLRIENWV